MKVSQRHPSPHRKYLVYRDDLVFTATPCYGLHSPWWVVRTMGDTPGSCEAEPELMRPDDDWIELTGAFQEALGEFIDRWQRIYEPVEGSR